MQVFGAEDIPTGVMNSLNYHVINRPRLISVSPCVLIIFYSVLHVKKLLQGDCGGSSAYFHRAGTVMDG